MIQVFKTNITRKRDVRVIVSMLKKEHPTSLINIDLYDCDKILRVDPQHREISTARIMNLVKSLNFYCEELCD
jgi:hypothetical protein